MNDLSLPLLLLGSFSIKVLNKYQNKNKTKKNAQTNKEKTKQNVKNKNKAKIIIHTLTFRGIVNVEKIYCDFFSCYFFSTDATHTYDIILNRHFINIACKFNKPCEVEITKLGLRSTTSQLYSEIRSRK
jgi:hypothetical protein